MENDKSFLQARCGAQTINPNKGRWISECNGGLVYIPQASPGERGGEGEKDEMGGEKHKQSLLIFLFTCVCSCHGTRVEVRGQLGRVADFHHVSPAGR